MVVVLHKMPKDILSSSQVRPNCRFDSIAHTGNAFGIFTASEGALDVSLSGAG